MSPVVFMQLNDWGLVTLFFGSVAALVFIGCMELAEFLTKEK